MGDSSSGGSLSPRATATEFDEVCGQSAYLTLVCDPCSRREQATRKERRLRSSVGFAENRVPHSGVRPLLSERAGHPKSPTSLSRRWASLNLEYLADVV